MSDVTLSVAAMSPLLVLAVVYFVEATRETIKYRKKYAKPRIQSKS